MTVTQADLSAVDYYEPGTEFQFEPVTQLGQLTQIYGLLKPSVPFKGMTFSCNVISTTSRSSSQYGNNFNQGNLPALQGSVLLH